MDITGRSWIVSWLGIELEVQLSKELWNEPCFTEVQLKL